MFEFALLGALVALVVAGMRSDETSPASPDGTPGGDGRECPYGPDKPTEKLPEHIRNAVIAALTMETDPEELEKMAASMDALCQPTSANSIRKKKKAIEDAWKAGLDPDATPQPTLGSWTDPDGVLVPNSPDPTSSFMELSAEKIGAAFPPIADCQSWATTIWWTGPYDSSKPLGLFHLAQAITGNGLRYVEIIQANSEKKSVGDPSNPMLTGFSFAAGIGDNERLRLPTTWDPMIDQTGRYAAGKVYPLCPPTLGPPPDLPPPVFP